MSVARHPRPPELVDTPIEEIMEKFVGRFREKKPDWAAFEDAKIEGFKRAQHRFIGAGGSGKHNDPTVIPAKNFTLSIMYVEPGQGNASHTHEVEEIFFVLQGYPRRLRRGRERQAPHHAARSVGMHRLSGRRHPRLSERQPRPGLFPGHAGPRQARSHGLRRRGIVQTPRRAPKAGVSRLIVPRSVHDQGLVLAMTW